MFLLAQAIHIKESAARKPHSRLAVLHGFSLSVLSWLVAPFCLWLKKEQPFSVRK